MGMALISKTLELLAASVGAIVMISWAFRAVSFMTFHFQPSRDSLKRYRRQQKAWAIVTGASAGIGYGHIQELAARDFNVIILAHKKDEVNEAVAQLKAEFRDTLVEAIVMDATTASYSDIESALAPFMHLPITILVNNVSVQSSTPTFTTFSSYMPEDIKSSIAANNLFTCNMTRVLYPVLKRNGPSLVINVSSGAHSLGLPWLTVYSGTKAFTESWSKALSREAKEIGDPIDSITIVPGDVRTPGNVYGVASGSPTGREFAKMALDRVGKAVSRNLMVFIPYWKHDITIGLTKTLPDSLVAPAAIADIAHRRTLEQKAQ